MESIENHLKKDGLTLDDMVGRYRTKGPIDAVKLKSNFKNGIEEIQPEKPSIKWKDH